MSALQLPVQAVEWVCHAATTIKDSSGNVLAECSGHGRLGTDAAAIAAEIVRRVNAHDELVAELTKAADQLQGWVNWKCPAKHVPEHEAYIAGIRKLIAKAEAS